MKKIIALALISIMLFPSACSKKVEDKPLTDTSDKTVVEDAPLTDTSDETVAEDTPITDSSDKTATVIPEVESSGTDCEIIELVSKNANGKKTVDWGDTEIIVLAPRFTGIKIDEIYSYKDYYAFNNDGLVSVDFSGPGYYIVDKNGEIVDYVESPLQKDIKHYGDSAVNGEGTQIGDNVKVIMTGEVGNYQQRLHTLDGKPLSDYFHNISHFYNGLALVEKDNKIGIIDESGATVLEPCIVYDKITYPPKVREFSVEFMNQDAFIIPIGGELAVINIKRIPKLFTLDENIPKYEYTYTPNLNKAADKAYADFVKDQKDYDGYIVKDLDGNGTNELVLKKSVAIFVYGYNGKVYEMGNLDFMTGTLRLLCSKDYPGIMVFTVGGGANLYRYVTVKNNKLVIEDIWKDYYSYDDISVKKRYESFTDDKDFIKASAVAYNNEQDIQFIKIG